MTLSSGGQAAIFLKTAALFACGMLASCSTLIGPRQVEVPLYKMQQGLERRFPIQNRLMSVLDVQLSHPQLSIQSGRDRVALAIDASVAPPFIRQTWKGSLALSGRLVLDAARSAVFISEASVDRMAIEGVDASQQRQFAKIVNLVGEHIMRDTPIYSFRQEDLRYAGVQFVPTRIATTAGGIVVTFEAVK